MYFCWEKKKCCKLICLQSAHERKCPICKIAKVDVELNYCTPTSWFLDQSKATSPDVLQFLYTSRRASTSVHVRTVQHKNIFTQFPFIITRKLFIKHCFGFWNTRHRSLMGALLSYFPPLNSYMAFPFGMDGSSFGGNKKLGEQACGGLWTPGRQCLPSSVGWGWCGGAWLLHSLRGQYTLLIPFPYLPPACTPSYCRLSLGPNPHSFHHSLLIGECVGEYAFMVCHYFTWICWWNCLLSTLWP